jgi:hypothetical protein
LILEAGSNIRSLKLFYFDYEYGQYYGQDPDRENVLVEVDCLTFVLKTCISLKQLKLFDSRFKYSLISQVRNKSSETIVIKNRKLPDPVFLHILTASVPSLKCSDIECYSYSGQPSVERFPGSSSTPNEDYYMYDITMPYTSFNGLSIAVRNQLDVILLVVKYIEDDVDQLKYFIHNKAVPMLEQSYEEYTTHQGRRYSVKKYCFYIHCLNIKEFRYTNGSSYNTRKIILKFMQLKTDWLAHQV